MNSFSFRKCSLILASLLSLVAVEKEEYPTTENMKVLVLFSILCLATEAVKQLYPTGLDDAVREITKRNFTLNPS